MSDSFNIQEAKKISLIQSFNALGYSPSTKMGQKQFRLFLNKKLPSGHFDNMLCNKLFQTLNIGENSSISIQEFVEGFILFEQEILRNAESFKVQLAKEKEIYNKILNQCQIYKSENLNSEGFSKNAKIYGEITDIDIKNKQEGIQEIILLLIFNDKKEELHFKIGDNSKILKKSFEFKPTSRRDHFEFVMKGLNDKGKEFDIGSKIFPLTDIESQEEYFVQIVVPELDNPKKIAAYINATILLNMSGYKYYESLRKKQEKRLNRYRNAANKAEKYVKYIREIYGDLSLMKPDLIVNYNNEKLMKRSGAKLNVNMINSIESQIPIPNYYVEFNNERQIQRMGAPLSVQFNNAKEIKSPIIETKKIEYSYNTNYNKLIENNSINKIEQNQVIYNNKENTYNNIQQVPIQFKNENQIKIEKENNNMKLYYDINNNEEDSSPQDLNKLYIDTQSNHQINYNNEQIQSSEQMESKSDLEEILEHQNDENKVIQNTQQIKSEIIQNIPIQNIQQKKVEITKNVIPIQNSSQNIQQKKVEIIQKVKPFQNNIYNIQQTKSEIIQNTIPIQRNVQGIQQQREEIVRIPFQNNVQNIQQKKEIIVQNIMPAQNNTQTTTNKKEEIVNIIPSQNYIQNVKQKNEEIVNILPPQNIQQNIEEKKVELGENSIPFQYNISKFNIQQNGAKINTKSFLKKSEFDNLETNIQQQKIEKVNNIGINPQKNIQKKQVLQTQVQEYNNKYNINAQQKMTSTAKTTSTIQKTVNKRQSQVKKHIKSQANININKGDIGEQHEIEENSKEGVTEYARASVYETVLDITKKKTIMQEIQKLKTIVKKADISVSVNKAIINEVTNKELISENTLPIQYLPEKIHNVIFQEKVITLPIINAGNKVIYKYIEPTIHKYDEYLKEINIINNNSINEYNYENLMSNEQKQSINNNIYNSENNINNNINSNLISSRVTKTDILQENIQPTQFKVQIKKLNEEKI